MRRQQCLLLFPLLLLQWLAQLIPHSLHSSCALVHEALASRTPSVQSHISCSPPSEDSSLFQLSPPNPNYLQNPNYQNAPGLFLLLLFSILLLFFFPTLTLVRSSLSPPQSLQPPILLQLANTSFTERCFRRTRKKYPKKFPKKLTIFFFKSFFISCSSNLFVIRCKTNLKILSTRVGVARNPPAREIAKSEGRRRWQNPSATRCSSPLNPNVLRPGPKRGPEISMF